MFHNLSTEHVARTSARRPKRTISVWLMALLVSFGLVGALYSSAVTTDFTFLNNAESKRADALLEQHLRGPDDVKEVVIVRSASLIVDDPAYLAFVERLHHEIESLGADAVAGAVHYYQTGDESLVSDDRHTTILPLVMAGEFKEAEASVKKVHKILDATDASSEFELFITGEATFSQDFIDGNQKDLEKGEAFGLPIALIILAVTFGALAAAVLPIVVAIVSIVIALGLAAVIGQVFELSSLVENMIMMIGLAVGIDYSLFIVSRYREERGRGLEKLDAIAAAGATASRAVLFSGVTVMVALLGLLIVPESTLVSVGLGAVLVVTVSVVASLTLLPAILSIMGDGVNRLRIPLLNRRQAQFGDRTRGFWDRVTYAVMRRPVISLVAASGLLIAAAIPYFSIETGSSGVSVFPDGFRSKQGFAVLQEEFGFGMDSPAEVVVSGDIMSAQLQDAIGSLQVALESDGAFGPSGVQVNERGDLALVSAPLVGDAIGEDNIRAVRKLREQHIPAAFSGIRGEALVTGTTAKEIDFIDIMRNYQPIVVALVLGLSFVFLTLVFRSIVVPIKAIIMNLLSVGAAYGLLVLVWQKGVGNELFGFPQVDIIQAWIPVFLFAVLFGLSMDYHVFLLSRIRERYDQTKNNAESVAYGLRSTAGLITGAALIMVAIFSGFAAGDVIPTAQFGFGMAVAIFLDATIVRLILVPATMKLLGDRNWYMPEFLHWLPTLPVESSKRSAGAPTT